ncbi:uncharacterized protein SPSK_06760 [Sporothrix schenckii 1099-18]|uniref:Uncharacterized protein n=1 Tax=Sporothrix schenckii 1099-18 TaxID=1397361 RepID=A0A0F2MM87_SPOSC|nr:uncharacterized protein SPSK_06760 [Sporothrix schenckii 1099-18]KJR89301.1 hypothetical protein SPSK_06760 [Sporothrix schenckii 1099-18]
MGTTEVEAVPLKTLESVHLIDLVHLVDAVAVPPPPTRLLALELSRAGDGAARGRTGSDGARHERSGRRMLRRKAMARETTEQTWGSHEPSKDITTEEGRTTLEASPRIQKSS